LQEKLQPCVVCGGEKFKYLFAVAGHPNFLCLECYLQFLSPQPSAERLGQIYSSHYSVTLPSAEIAELKRKTAALYLKQLQSETAVKPGMALLEIGCGRGDFLIEAKLRGLAVKGIEFSQHFVDQTNLKLGENAVVCGEIYNVSFGQTKFDIVVANDVIEHVRNPVVFLERVANLLAENGVFFCTVPSLSSWSAKLMGRCWMEYKEEHLYYYQPKNLARLLKRVGFNKIKILSNRKILSLGYVIAHFERYQVPYLTTLLIGAKKFIPDVALKYAFEIEASGMTVIAKF
jgi:2-polyprenyl-3-methyl-5-hydroxy-6-metoxy-1,4-benzoquinol methylase